MIEVVLFYAHVLFFTYIFSKNYVQEGFLSAFLSAIFVVVIFTVGWTFSAFVIQFFIPDEGLNKIMTRAAFSLALLTIMEAFFYKLYYGRKKVVKA